MKDIAPSLFVHLKQNAVCASKNSNHRLMRLIRIIYKTKRYKNSGRPGQRHRIQQLAQTKDLQTFCFSINLCFLVSYNSPVVRHWSKKTSTSIIVKRITLRSHGLLFLVTILLTHLFIYNNLII